MNNFGTTMRNARVKLGKSLDAMAIEVGLSKSTISRFENGHIFPPISRIPELAKAYNIAVEAFQGRPPRKLCSRQTEPSISFDDNIADIIDTAAMLKLQTLSVNDLLFLMGIRKQIGAKLSATLVSESLALHKQAK